jgi:hypothetical protein
MTALITVFGHFWALFPVTNAKRVSHITHRCKCGRHGTRSPFAGLVLARFGLVSLRLVAGLGPASPMSFDRLDRAIAYRRQRACNRLIGPASWPVLRRSMHDHIHARSDTSGLVSRFAPRPERACAARPLARAIGRPTGRIYLYIIARRSG